MVNLGIGLLLGKVVVLRFVKSAKFSRQIPDEFAQILTRLTKMTHAPPWATDNRSTGALMQQTFETWITPIMVGGLIIFMCFIIWDLAKKSNAGKFGTIMLFVVLGAGMLGYVIKVVITWLIEGGGI
jgi:hypothetical protein|tara:strand:+ start:1050 stop:1430 length:381 start_codon:yes stop_codon:yes gene_type:complete